MASKYASVPVEEIIAAGLADIDGRPPFRLARKPKPPRKKRKRCKFGKRETVPTAPMLDAFLESIGVV